MKKLLYALLVLLVFILASNYIPHTTSPADTPVPNESHRLKVHFLDVGQGDCIFVQLPNGHTMLIDSGERGNAQNIISYITDLGYSEIDYVVCTHPHSDHIGSMENVLEALDAKSIYMPRKAHTSAMYIDLLKTIRNQGKKIKEAAAGVTICEGEDMSVRIVSPVKDYDNLNDISAVILLKYRDSSFLFTGDIENTASKDITEDIDADVLKVAHHGSSNAISKGLIRKITPEIAVISCGTDNPYGHPHRETMKLMDDYDIDCYRTDISGNIVITTDGNEYHTICERN